MPQIRLAPKPPLRTTPGVMVRLGSEWSQVGRTTVVLDERSGMRLLRLDLVATAPVLYVALDEVGLLLDSSLALLEDAPAMAMGQA